MLITYPYRNNLSAYAPGVVGMEGRHARNGLPEGPGRDKDLPDPWYGDYGDFVDTLAVIERSTPALVDYVRP